MKQRNFAGKVRIRMLRWIAGNFPANSIRVAALRACGFNIGHKVYIAEGLKLSMMNSAHTATLTIGDRVSIGPNVTLVLSSHANHSALTAAFPPVHDDITIDDDCWLGAGVIITPGVTMNKKSAAAAGAVIVKDVPSYHLVGGVPAKIIREFKDDMMQNKSGFNQE